MPPWKPERGVGPKLKHDQSLSREEIAILEAWAEAGARRATPSTCRRRPGSPRAGSSGRRTSCSSRPRDFTIPASGPDTYRCFVIPTNLAQDTYISAIDFRPGNPRVVHHINAFLDTSGDARKRDEAEPGPGYTSFSGPGIEAYEELSFWAAGHEPSHFPAGIGQRLPRQSDVILQIHYHPTGKARGRPHAHRRLFLARAGQAGAPLEHRVELGFPAPGGRPERRGQGELVHPRRRRGPGRLPPHAPARA